MHDLKIFFESEHFVKKHNRTYLPVQMGSSIISGDEAFASWQEADLVIVGCPARRGEKVEAYGNSVDAIRENLYSTYCWHPDTRIVDLGNVTAGATQEDTRAALLISLEEIHQAGKIAIVLGGDHDLTLQQYNVYKRAGQLTNFTVADAFVDVDDSGEISAGTFLMELFITMPNFLAHYAHLGFQSFSVHPRILETLDKLRFDFYRLGKLREHIEEAEPVLRNSHIFSFDMSAVKYGDAPANIYGSPNGFSGEEACLLARYAGMSDMLTSFGIFEYNHLNDTHEMTAKLIAQMIWYFIDGYQVRLSEARLSSAEDFVSYHVHFTDNDTQFLKSKRTNRWWMQLPNLSYVPCSYSDYLTASKNEIPERWLREQERLADVSVNNVAGDPA
jgi:formiminoglutamase